MSLKEERTATSLCSYFPPLVESIDGIRCSYNGSNTGLNWISSGRSFPCLTTFKIRPLPYELDLSVPTDGYHKYSTPYSVVYSLDSSMRTLASP